MKNYDGCFSRACLVENSASTRPFVRKWAVAVLGFFATPGTIADTRSASIICPVFAVCGPVGHVFDTQSIHTSQLLARLEFTQLPTPH